MQHNTFFNNDQENGPNGEIPTTVATASIVNNIIIMYGNGSKPAIETGDPRPLAGEDDNEKSSRPDPVATNPDQGGSGCSRFSGSWLCS